jgi:hypothetical protein
MVAGSLLEDSPGKNHNIIDLFCRNPKINYLEGFI